MVSLYLISIAQPARNGSAATPTIGVTRNTTGNIREIGTHDGSWGKGYSTNHSLEEDALNCSVPRHTLTDSVGDGTFMLQGDQISIRDDSEHN